MSYHDTTWRSADGLTLHARDYPADAGKAPVVCIHGLTRNAKDFEALALRIQATGRRVIAVDIRGRGESDRDPNPTNYHGGVYAQDVVGLLDHLHIPKAIFIGTSMGGLITMILASFAPEVIAGAVLNDIGPELAPAGVARITGYVGQAEPVDTWAQAADYAKSVNGPAFPDMPDADWDAFARRIFREEDGRPVLDYDPAIALAFRPDPDAPAPTQPDIWPLFRALAKDRPMLLIRGGLSDLLDDATVARMREAAPEMAYAEVDRVGHAPMLTEPQAWAAIESFLARVP